MIWMELAYLDLGGGGTGECPLLILSSPPLSPAERGLFGAMAVRSHGTMRSQNVPGCRAA